jgi:hypothetical protein
VSAGAQLAGGLLGSFGLLVATFVATAIIVGDPLAAVGLGTLSLALSSLWPPGGGMAWQGTFRSRVFRHEWTQDIDRSSAQAFFASLLLAGVTTLGFAVPLPFLVLIWKFDKPFSISTLMWVAVILAVLISRLRYKAELPLRKWVEAPGDFAARALMVEGLAQPDGGIGHVGGIGALTVGLHDHLNGLEVLLGCKAGGAPVDAAVIERGLDYLQKQEVPGGGFCLYPGAQGRLEATVRAVKLLGPRLDAAALGRHRAFIASCKGPSGRWLRSPYGPEADVSGKWSADLPT